MDQYKDKADYSTRPKWVNHFAESFIYHYENTRIQIYWKFYNQKMKIVR